MAHLWNEMTWLEIRDAAAVGRPVVLPVGCVETQGPYTPVGMEEILSAMLAADVAKETNALALPAIPYGNSDMFASLPGTIYIRPETLAKFYFDVLASIAKSGFDKILCLAYHIPNAPALEQAARRLRIDTGVSVYWLNPGALAATYLQDYFDDPAEARGHGAEPGLSLMRYVLGSSVPDEPIQEMSPTEYRGMTVSGANLTFDGFPVGMPFDWDELYPHTGGFGNTTYGSEEIGKLIYERLLNHLTLLVESIKQGTDSSK